MAVLLAALPDNRTIRAGRTVYLRHAVFRRNTVTCADCGGSDDRLRHAVAGFRQIRRSPSWKQLAEVGVRRFSDLGVCTITSQRVELPELPDVWTGASLLHIIRRQYGNAGGQIGSAETNRKKRLFFLDSF